MILRDRSRLCLPRDTAQFSGDPADGEVNLVSDGRLQGLVYDLVEDRVTGLALLPRCDNCNVVACQAQMFALEDVAPEGDCCEDGQRLFDGDALKADFVFSVH